MSNTLKAAVTALGLIGAAPSASAAVTLINVFEAPAEQLDAAIAGWEAARDFLAKEPGYISTSLHQALTSDARFQLINVAIWESPAAFQAAIGKMQAAKVFPRLEGVIANPALYRVIRTDGGVQ